jgi:hypothetical protein
LHLSSGSQALSKPADKAITNSKTKREAIKMTNPSAVEKLESLIGLELVKKHIKELTRSGLINT